MSECGDPVTFEYVQNVLIQLKDGPDSKPIFTYVPRTIDVTEDTLVVNNYLFKNNFMAVVR